MAELGRLVKREKRKRVLIKCQGSPNPSPPRELEYNKKLCLCVARGDDPSESYNSSEWYIITISSNQKEEDEEVEETKGKGVLSKIPSAQLRGAYIAFHHEEHHRGEATQFLSPVKELKKRRAFRSQGTCCAAIGSTIYRIGGDRGGVLRRPWSRKVMFFDFSRPEQRWKRGNSTLCGRSNTPVVAVDEKLYVFGGRHCDFPGVWAECLDTNGAWNPIPDPPHALIPPSSLGFLHLQAVPLGGDFSKKILVFSKLTKALCLYDVEKQVWETLDSIRSGSCFRCPPIVVATTMYWLNHEALCAYDFVEKSLISMPITDYNICWFLEGTREHPNEMKPTLVHLVGDDFALLWMGEDAASLHCTKLKISKEVGAVLVLSCRKYLFDHRIRLLDCLAL